MKIQIRNNIIRVLTLLLSAVFLAPGVTDAARYKSDTTVYCDALWMRVHAEDCPELILKENKKTMTLEEADKEGWRIGESGQSGRGNCCFIGYEREYPKKRSLMMLSESFRYLRMERTNGIYPDATVLCPRKVTAA